jgi:rhamnosyltransferase
MKTIPGLIITFNPHPDFFTRLDSFYSQLDQIILVDNGSDPEVCRLLKQEAQRRKSSLTVIFNETNLGVATALNQGFRWALEQGFPYIVTFDQDSHPAAGMISAMFEVFATYSKDGRLAVVAPVVTDPVVSIQALYLRPKNRILFERASCDGNVLENVTFVITSGALYDLAAYRQIGPFRDDFFIDYVDIEYCLRAQQHGYRIIVACKAKLDHRQGERQKRVFFGRDHYPTFHSPLRWYFFGRNRIPMLRQYAFRFPHWFLYEVVAGLYILTKMLLFETQKLVKLQAFFLGSLDGIRRRMGNAPNSVLALIDHA